MAQETDQRIPKSVIKCDKCQIGLDFGAKPVPIIARGGPFRPELTGYAQESAS
jgi:hypothetical protein